VLLYASDGRLEIDNNSSGADRCDPWRDWKGRNWMFFRGAIGAVR